MTLTFPVEFDWPQERPHFAMLAEVHDGDTLVCDVDLDFHFEARHYKVRLEGCNAWELATAAGKAARANLATLIPVGTELVMTSIKSYKFGGGSESGVARLGEFVARIWLPDGTELVPLLIAQQWVAQWDGLGPRPVPPWPRTIP